MQKKTLSLLIALSCLGISNFALAQEAQKGGQSLEQAANDPTASLMSLQLADWYAFKYHNGDYHDNSVVLRAAIPFQLGGQNHIMRVTAPFITDHPFAGTGLSDTTIFDLMAFNESWGRWGVGAVAVLPTGGADRGAEQWGLGPALGFVARKSGLMWGVFNQNVFTVAGKDNRDKISQSSLQPIFNYRLGSGWSASFSEMQITYNWDKSRWTSLPLGFGISKLHKFGRLPVQFNFQYEHNFVDKTITASDTVRFTTKILLPGF